MKFTPEFEALFAPEPPDPGTASDPAPWKLLLVDDEPDIHAVMRLALGDAVVMGRRLQLFGAGSAAQARQHLQQHPDTALVLLDVVMETERAGLDLVNHVRQELQNQCLQIVLVTGQPGYAPLRDVVARYDIDGYRLKSELTTERLLAVVTRSLRTHRLLLELHAERERYRQQTVALQDRQAELEAAQRRLENAVLERTSALEQNMQRLVDTQFAMDRVGLAIAWVDARSLRLSYVNETACEQLGYTRDELLQMTVRDLNPETEGPVVQGLLQGLQTRDHFGPVETWHRRKDGSTYPAEVTVYRRTVAGDASYITFFSDISARQASALESRERLEQVTQSNLALQALNEELRQAHSQLLQSEKMASIGLLAAGVAHEINNPIGYVRSNLGSLRGYVDDFKRVLDAYARAEALCGGDGTAFAEVRRLKEETEFDYVQGDLQALLDESAGGLDRVTRIVQNLKDFSRADEEETWVCEDVHRGLDSTLSVTWNHLKYTCELRKDYGELPPIECLPSQLNQIFLNLLVNAADAIEGRGVVTVRTRHCVHEHPPEGVPAEEVQIEIIDTGKGIEPANLKRLFDPFFTTKPVGKGTGLGLSVSYNIVRKHHGRIEVESIVGRGTTFRVCLPVRQPPAAPSQPTAGAVPEPWEPELQA